MGPVQTNPLLYEPISINTIQDKLAHMRAAIATGADPNEYDGLRKHQIGRPLHYAIANEAGHAFVSQNLPVVMLLLEAGADPRLRALPDVPILNLLTYGESALDESRHWLEALERSGGMNWSVDDIALKPFYLAAYKAMKKVADKLDAQDETQRREDLLEKNGYDRNGSWLSWLKFW